MKASLGWAFRMAWRDGRRSWPRLLLYVSATSLGVAALIAADSFRHNLQEAIRQQAKPLLGADIVVQSRHPFSRRDETLFAELPAARLGETRLSTVAFFPAANAGRLVELRAIDEGYPFYGRLETTPPEAGARLFREPAVLLPENVMAEFGLEPGDRVQAGRAEFRVAGSFLTAPGEAFVSAFEAPRAYIASSQLPATGLLREESFSRHTVLFKVADKDLDGTVARLNAVSEEKGWRVTTVQRRRESLGRRAGNAARFLKFAALASLLLGGLGVSGIFLAYARDKTTAAATLKCLGASATGTLSVFFIQGAALGTAGTLFGGAAGLLVQASLPALARQFSPVEIPLFVSWRSVFNGVAVGFAVSTLFAVLPLLSLRSIPPLAAFRADTVGRNRWKDPAVWTAGAALAAILFGIARSELDSAWQAGLVPAGTAGALGLLALFTRIALVGLRKRFPARWPYPWRYGLANLFRPNSQTFILVPVLGVGAALLFAISFLKNSILGSIDLANQPDQPTMAFVDVQADQRTGTKEVLQSRGAAVLDEVPIVTMRIHRIKDRLAADLRRNDAVSIPRWALNREYRSTYRNALTPGERVLAGEWPPAPFAEEAVPVSVEEEIARDLGVSLGDTLVFDVQGVLVTARVAALRKVDWFQLRPNFFLVFPEGVLEEAPQFFVLTARTASPEQAGGIQAALRKEFPNVSAIDLGVVLATLDEYFSKVAGALRFMALFILFAGGLILAGALAASGRDRMREAALLRALGASRIQVGTIHFIEYVLTGLFAGMLGLALGWAGSFAVTQRFFEISFQPGWVPALSGVAGLVVLTASMGLFLGRGPLRFAPLQALRDEG
jgi:putative ABC transport system permease protein